LFWEKLGGIPKEVTSTPGGRCPAKAVKQFGVPDVTNCACKWCRALKTWRAKKAVVDVAMSPFLPPAVGDATQSKPI